MKLSIKNITNEPDVCEFIHQHPQKNIFQTIEMFEIYSFTKNYEPVFLCVQNEANEILGTLLAVIQKEYSGILGTFSSRSIIWGGPLIKDNNSFILDFILAEYNKIIKKRAVYTQFRNFWNWSEYEKNIFINNGYFFEEHLDIIHDLSQNPDQQILKMSQGRRKNIRRAIKQNVSFEEINSKQEFLQSLNLIKQTYKKVKLPMPDDSYFIHSYDTLQSKNFVKFFKATYNENLIGVRFVLCFNNLIYDWYAGSSDDYLDKYPNDFLPWKIMEWGHTNGFKIFDFGGAGKPDKEYGVRDYKLKFGGELVNYGRFELTHNNLIFNLAKIGFIIWKKVK